MARFSLRRKRADGALAPPQPAPPPPPGQPAAPGEPVHPGQTSLAGAPAPTGQTAIQGAPTPTGRPAGPAPTSPPVTKPPGRIPPPGAPTTMPPRPTLEGLRAWLATLDRRLGIRTYLGIAAVILALAASAVAIVLAIDARDNSADNDDLNAISERVNELDGGTTDTGLTDASIEARLTALEDQISNADDGAGGAATAQRLDVLENDVEELRSQLDDLESSGGNP
jgi:hypothetical protein